MEYRFGADLTVPAEIEWLSDHGSCYMAAETRFDAHLHSADIFLAGDATGRTSWVTWIAILSVSRLLNPSSSLASIRERLE